MPGIFISYRRQDSQDFTGRIYDRLAATLGEQNIFRDIDDIPIGQDFRTVLDRETGKCDILLVIIGPKWLNIQDQNGKRRLDDPNDFVRIEVESGLKRPDRLVIPVLVNNTPMPQASELPESLQQLAYRNAAVVRQDPDFHHDMEKLIRQIKLSGSPGLSLYKKYLPLGIGLLAAAIICIVGINWYARSVVSKTTDFLLTNPPLKASPNLATDIPKAPITGTIESGLPYTLVAGTRFEAQYGFSLYEYSSQDSKILSRVESASTGVIVDQNADRKWTKIQLNNGKEGWALSDDLSQNTKLATPTPPRAEATIALGQGYGLRTDAWQLYFTNPEQTADSDNKSGIDFRMADAISRAKTIDMAIYELSNLSVTQALLEAYQRGAKIRIVTDDESGLNGMGTTLTQLQNAGIPIVTDNRSALMHDKFVILDGASVWTGSWNLTEDSTFKQNNNAFVLTAPEVVAAFEEQFNKMFEQRLFGPDTPKTSKNVFSANGITVEVYFTPQDAVQEHYTSYIKMAQRSIRMMAFTFTDSDLGNAILEKFKAGLPVQILTETTGSATPYSQARALFCVGVNVQLDGNPNLMHHKVIMIDDQIVITGSLNFTSNALVNNNENIVIVHDPLLAKAYYDELVRLWAISKIPSKADMGCQ